MVDCDGQAGISGDAASDHESEANNIRDSQPRNGDGLTARDGPRQRHGGHERRRDCERCRCHERCRQFDGVVRQAVVRRHVERAARHPAADCQTGRNARRDALPASGATYRAAGGERLREAEIDRVSEVGGAGRRCHVKEFVSASGRQDREARFGRCAKGAVHQLEGDARVGLSRG